MAEMRTVVRRNTNFTPHVQSDEGQDLEAGTKRSALGSLLVNESRAPSPTNPPASHHDAAEPISDNTVQDEIESSAKKGVDDEEKAQYANQMIGTISNTLVKHGTIVASWDLPFLASFVDVLKHATNACRTYYNVRKPEGKVPVFKLEMNTTEEAATALLDMIRDDISGKVELNVSNWSRIELSAFCSCITETFNVTLALYNEKKDGSKAGLEVKQESQTDESD